MPYGVGIVYHFRVPGYEYYLKIRKPLLYGAHQAYPADAVQLDIRDCHVRAVPIPVHVCHKSRNPAKAADGDRPGLSIVGKDIIQLRSIPF